MFGGSFLPTAISSPDGTTWSACPNGETWQFTFDPGETATVDIWALLPLSNEYPELKPEDQGAMVWAAPAIDTNASLGETEVVAVGPNAVSCSIPTPNDSAASVGLALYQSPPFTFTAVDISGGVNKGECLASDSDGSLDSSDGGTTSTVTAEELCYELYGPINNETRDVGTGSVTDYDRNSSLSLVCSGFGFEDPEFPPQMACAVIAAAAIYGSPAPVGYRTSSICDVFGVAMDVEENDWVGAATGATCSYLSDLFATAVGIAAATASSASGPGAVAIGVTAYKAMAATLQLACGGLLDQGAHDLGVYLETKHEANVALDISQLGKCLRERNVAGQISFRAVDCV